jgi:hypothetical protein
MMYTTLSKNSKQLALITSSMLLLLACGLFGGRGESASETPPTVQPELTPTATPTSLPPVIVETEPPIPPEADACPDRPVTYGLQANHHFLTPTEMGDWVWQAAGLLQVDLDAQGKVSSTGTQIIPGSQSGQFSSGENSCSFEAPAEVVITLIGACVDSVLSLEIWEDWQMGTYDWVCDDDSFQFDLPPQMMPPSVHKMEYSLGSGGSYSFEIPFGGGSGTKTYTLILEY